MRVCVLLACISNKIVACDVTGWVFGTACCEHGMGGAGFQAEADGRMVVVHVHRRERERVAPLSENVLMRASSTCYITPEKRDIRTRHSFCQGRRRVRSRFQGIAFRAIVALAAYHSGTRANLMRTCQRVSVTGSLKLVWSHVGQQSCVCV